MTELKRSVRTWLLSKPAWLSFQEARREGFVNALVRRHYQRQILDTPPLHTPSEGKVEVRVLTWRRDWVNMIWALKSFYHFTDAPFPLFIHDGGLLPDQAARLREHFPDAIFVGRDEGDRRIAAEFERLGLKRCAAYRALNASTRKLFDFFAFSNADYLVSIDSDIVFFEPAEHLLVPPGGLAVNRYNRDASDWYSMTPDELEQAFGIRPPTRINSGLFVVQRQSIDFDQVDQWLAHPKLFADRWVTEQTLHALCSTVHGVEFLPEAYQVGDDPGFVPGVICKHYPGFLRKNLYREGMKRLIGSGFLADLRAGRKHSGRPAGPVPAGSVEEPSAEVDGASGRGDGASSRVESGPSLPRALI